MAAKMMMLAFILVLGAVMATTLKAKALPQLKSELAKLELSELMLLLISASVFLLTFLVFNNWSYRLIFIVPSFMVLAQVKAPLAQVTRLLIGGLFWVPILPNGWELQNLVCFALAILMAVIVGATLVAPPLKKSVVSNS
jgi:hypothetical protein